MSLVPVSAAVPNCLNVQVRRNGQASLGLSVRSLGYLLAATVCCALDVGYWLTTKSDPQPWEMVMALGVVAAVPLVHRFPRAAGAASLAFVLWGSLAANASASTTFLVVIPLADWISRDWWKGAAGGFIAYWITNLIGTSRPDLEPAALTLISLLAISLGLAMRGGVRAREEARLRVEAAQAEGRAQADEVRGEIALMLHDSVATDLTRVLTLARVLRPQLHESAQVALAKEIEESATDSMNSLRALVGSLRQTPSSSSDATSAGAADLVPPTERWGRVLATRGISLSTRGITWQEARLAVGDSEWELAAIAVQESLVNIVKYAKAGSEASLELSLDQDSLVVELVSRTADEQPDQGGALSGGQGLNGLATRASALGGELVAGDLNGRWLVALTVPRRTDPHGSTT